jgi:hypothetical protein
VAAIGGDKVKRNYTELSLPLPNYTGGLDEAVNGEKYFPTIVTHPSIDGSVPYIEVTLNDYPTYSLKKALEEAKEVWFENTKLPVAEHKRAHQTKKSRELAITKLKDVELKTKSRNQKRKQESNEKNFDIKNERFLKDPFLLKIFEDYRNDWKHLISNIEEVEEGEGKELKNHNDFAFPGKEGELNGKKVYVIFPYLQKVRFKDVPPKSRKLVKGYDMRLIYDMDEEGNSTKSLVLIR